MIASIVSRINATTGHMRYALHFFPAALRATHASHSPERSVDLKSAVRERKAWFSGYVFVVREMLQALCLPCERWGPMQSRRYCADKWWLKGGAPPKMILVFRQGCVRTRSCASCSSHVRGVL